MTTYTNREPTMQELVWCSRIQHQGDWEAALHLLRARCLDDPVPDYLAMSYIEVADEMRRMAPGVSEGQRVALLLTGMAEPSTNEGVNSHGIGPADSEVDSSKLDTVLAFIEATAVLVDVMTPEDQERYDTELARLQDAATALSERMTDWAPALITTVNVRKAEEPHGPAA